MSRPYLTHGIKQLEDAFEASVDDSKKLKLLLAELELRRVPKAILLRAKIGQRLAQLKDEAAIRKAAVMHPQQPSLFDNSPPPERPRQGSLFGPEAVTQPLQKPLDKPSEMVMPLAKVRPDRQAQETDDAPSFTDTGRSARTHAAQTKAHPTKVATIRPPGRMSGLPSKRQFELKTDVEVKYDRNAGAVARFVGGLKALVAEMRRKGTGAKLVIVEDGKRVPLDGREMGYQFPYEGDGELFEGAKVRAVVNGQQSDGRIVSVFNRQIIVSFDVDFGTGIDVCQLRIDNTAMLDALRERLEKIAGGEVTNFNALIANGVLQNSGGEAPSVVSPITDDDELNERQMAAVREALQNPMSYLWGPPGTGKTKAISAICKSLFETNRRVLICSNTNQAVDQVLNKLCRSMGKEHKAVREGRILRIGRIVLEELEKDWREYVTLDGIVDRLKS